MRQLAISVDWYDEVCQRLDLLQRACSETGGNESPPPAHLFERAKNAIDDLRRAVGFSIKLPTADVWAGPNGELGFTWEFNDEKSVDLIFGLKSCSANYTEQLKQSPVEANELPKLLSELAANT